MQAMHDGDEQEKWQHGGDRRQMVQCFLLAGIGGSIEPACSQAALKEDTRAAKTMRETRDDRE